LKREGYRDDTLVLITPQSGMMVTMDSERGSRRIRRALAAGFGLAGAIIMFIDSLGHIARGFIGLSLMLIVGVAAAAAGVGLVLGIVVEGALARKRER
jgi:hypothetical protein